jgi:hypothetical protein
MVNQLIGCVQTKNAGERERKERERRKRRD